MSAATAVSKGDRREPAWDRHSEPARLFGHGLRAIVSCAANGNIFQSSLVDQIAGNVLALFALIYVPSVGVQLYGEIGRIDRSGLARKA